MLSEVTHTIVRYFILETLKHLQVTIIGKDTLKVYYAGTAGYCL